jgi:S-formylglutathione hydrolase FrmB
MRSVLILSFSIFVEFAICPRPATAQYDDACYDLIVQEPPYPGHPRVVADEVAGIKMNVLLPADYAMSGARRYPVLYLFGGFSMNQDSWLVFSDVEELTEPFTGDQGVIVVMPAGSWLGVWTDYRNGTQLWETLFVDELVPHVDASYRTVADRGHRAIAGLSSGGITAELLSAYHPDLFAAAGSFSGTVTTRSASPAFEMGLYAVDLAVSTCAGGQPGDAGVFGDPLIDDVYWHDIFASDLVPNFGGVALYFSAGNGVLCDERDIDDLLNPPSQAGLAWQNLEPLLRAGAEDFHAALTEAGVAHTADLRSCGIHSWRYFEKDLHTFWPIMAAAFGAPPPAAFDMRRVLAEFSAYGWTFQADPNRAVEFLTVADASPSGVGLTGSGVTTVTTASYFAPAQTVGLSGALEPTATADSEGRITFTVDLGPAHTQQQYTAVARILEAAGGYFTSRTVNFKPE